MKIHKLRNSQLAKYVEQSAETLNGHLRTSTNDEHKKRVFHASIM